MESGGRKVCRTCREEKSLAEFYPKKTRKDGSILYRTECNTCCITASEMRRRRKTEAMLKSLRSPDLACNEAGQAGQMSASKVCEKAYRGVHGAIKFEDADFQAVVKVFKTLQRWRDELAVRGSS